MLLTCARTKNDKLKAIRSKGIVLYADLELRLSESGQEQQE